MQRFLKNNRIGAYKKGFTLMEIIIVVAILAVLMGIGVVGVEGYIKSSEKIKRMDTAETTFYALSDYLTALNQQGAIEEFNAKVEKMETRDLLSGSDINNSREHFHQTLMKYLISQNMMVSDPIYDAYKENHSTAKLDDLGRTVYTYNEIVAFTYAGDGENPDKNSPIYDVLFECIGDEELLAHAFLFEYNKTSGVLQAVFYAPELDSFDLTSAYADGWEDYFANYNCIYRDKESVLEKEQGYFGVFDTSAPLVAPVETSENNPEAELVNDDRLYLKFTRSIDSLITGRSDESEYQYRLNLYVKNPAGGYDSQLLMSDSIEGDTNNKSSASITELLDYVEENKAVDNSCAHTIYNENDGYYYWLIDCLHINSIRHAYTDNIKQNLGGIELENTEIYVDIEIRSANNSFSTGGDYELLCTSEVTNPVYDYYDNAEDAYYMTCCRHFYNMNYGENDYNYVVGDYIDLLIFEQEDANGLSYEAAAAKYEVDVTDRHAMSGAGVDFVQIDFSKSKTANESAIRSAVPFIGTMTGYDDNGNYNVIAALDVLDANGESVSLFTSVGSQNDAAKLAGICFDWPIYQGGYDGGFLGVNLCRESIIEDLLFSNPGFVLDNTNIKTGCLFKNVYDRCTVKNVELTDGWFVNSGNGFGIIAYSIDRDCTVCDCSISGSNEISAVGDFGGIAVESYSDIVRCSVECTAEISNDIGSVHYDNYYFNGENTVATRYNIEESYAGGIVAYIEGNVTDCSVNGDFNNDNYFGGIAGYCKGTIKNCSFGTVEEPGLIEALDTSLCAGIAGYCYSLENCQSFFDYSIGVANTGEAVASTGKAGIVGICISPYGRTSIKKCKFTGDIKFGTNNVNSAYNIAGIVSYAKNCDISECEYKGDIFNAEAVAKNVNYIAGIASYNEGSISKCSAKLSNIYGNSYVSGVCAYLNGNIDNSYMSGASATDKSNVIGKNYIGGVCGYVNGDVNACYATSSVLQGDLYLGGLCGVCNGRNVNNSYLYNSDVTKNNVEGYTGYAYTGGLVGCNLTSDEIKFDYSYLNAVTVTSKQNGTVGVGGLIGSIKTYAKISFYDCSIDNACSVKVVSTDAVSRIGGYIGEVIYGALTVSNPTIDTNPNRFSIVITASGSEYVGGIAGNTQSEVNISHTQVSCDISSNGTFNYVGDMVGATNGNVSIYNVKCTGSIFTNKKIACCGSAIGLAKGNTVLKNANSTFKIESDTDLSSVGGMIGYTADGIQISDSIYDGKIITKTLEENVGGFIGYAYKDANLYRLTLYSNAKLYSEKVASFRNVGGMVGRVDGILRSDVLDVKGLISTKGNIENVGGVCGSANNGVELLSVTSNIQIQSNGTVLSTGGIIGSLGGSQSSIRQSTYDAMVASSGNQKNVGGFVGYSNSDSLYITSSNSKFVAKCNGEYELRNVAAFVGHANGNFTGETLNIYSDEGGNFLTSGNTIAIGGAVGRATGVINISGINVSFVLNCNSTMSNFGGVAGVTENTVTVVGSKIVNTIANSGGEVNGAGGLIGYMMLGGNLNNNTIQTLSIVSVNANLSGTGGIVGCANSEDNAVLAIDGCSIEKCSLSGNANTQRVGGFIGYVSKGKLSRLQNCSIDDTGSIRAGADSNYIGGAVGYLYNGVLAGDSIISVVNVKTPIYIKSGGYVGGFVGYIYSGGTINNLTLNYSVAAEGKVTYLGSYIGRVLEGSNATNIAASSAYVATAGDITLAPMKHFKASSSEAITFDTSTSTIVGDLSPDTPPAKAPSRAPANTPKPTATPTPGATATATPTPTASPTPEPTVEPTPEPTASPTPEPTASPTPEPTASSTPEPTAEPTPEPTAEPTPEPTAEPTAEPTPEPTVEPTP